MDDLERRFDADMHDIYVRAKAEAHYNATRFLQMLHEHGGLATAHLLLQPGDVSAGYAALWERGRLDLTVEVLALQPVFAALFAPDELAVARRRLHDYGYEAKKDGATM